MKITEIELNLLRNALHMSELKCEHVPESKRLSSLQHQMASISHTLILVLDSIEHRELPSCVEVHHA